MFIAWFGDAGVIYATGAMTLLVLVFGEVLPKTYAFSKANSTALWIAPLIRPLVVLLAPITHSIQVFIRLVLRPFGVDFEAGEQALGFSADELRGAIELHAGQVGSISHERAMLRSVLELVEVQVGEIMIHRKNVIMLDVDRPATETSAPVSATISPNVPAVSARTSTVTLSVSSSTSGSSTATASPTFLNLLATVASLTDSPKVGTLISAIFVPSSYLVRARHR